MSHLSADRYSDIWREFLTTPRVLHTLNIDHQKWRRGRERYYAWVLQVTDDSVRRRHRHIRQELSGFLIEPSKRFLHVTVFVCGFIVDTPVYSDDMATSTLMEQKTALSELMLPAFLLKIAGVNSFRSTPFLEVACPGRQILTIRQRLLHVGKEQRFAPYDPHLTIGLYASPTRTSQLAKRLNPFRGLPSMDYLVPCLDLVSFDASEVEGELCVEDRIWFKS